MHVIVGVLCIILVKVVVLITIKQLMGYYAGQILKCGWL